MPDWLRLAVGTLTVLRVPPPRQVDRRVAGGAMLAAPVVGLMLAIPAGVLCGVLPAVATGHRALVALLTAALTVALVAGLTRAIHLDGLAEEGLPIPPPHSSSEVVEVGRR